jgi:hypothetical protein
MGRIFNRALVPGMPLSFRGLIRGLLKIDYALTNMSVENGRVDWSALGAPTIVFGDDGAGSSAQFIQNVQSIATGGLPSGGDEYQVLQRDADGAAVWDWVRVNAPEEE